MSNSSSSSSGGVGVLGLLGVAFVVLKLTGVINWSWWWVTAPFWVGVPLVLLIVLGIFAVVVIRHSIDRRKVPKGFRRIR